jgi:hypothetical protein
MKKSANRVQPPRYASHRIGREIKKKAFQSRIAI